MTNQLINSVHINADNETIRRVCRFVEDHETLTRDSGARIMEYGQNRDQLTLHYYTDAVEVQPVEELAKAFPSAHIAMFFHTPNYAYEGFVEYRHGHEVSGGSWEDCGGA